ncbi:MAG TPA: hypothetical protein VGH56_05760 [Solirubrobacteraceae bacterium]
MEKDPAAAERVAGEDAAAGEVERGRDRHLENAFEHVHDRSIFWSARLNPPPAGACEIDTRGLPGAALFFGWVVPRVHGFPGLSGRPFLACSVSEFGYQYAGVIPAILLDATHFGAAALAWPGSRDRRLPVPCTG